MLHAAGSMYVSVCAGPALRARGAPYACFRGCPCRYNLAAYAPRIFVVGERPSQASIAKLIANFLGVSAIDLIG